MLTEKGLSAVQLLAEIEENLGFSNTSRLVATPTLPLPQLASLSPTTSAPLNDLTENMTPLKRFKSNLLDQFIPPRSAADYVRNLTEEYNCYLEKARTSLTRQDAIEFWKNNTQGLPKLARIAQAVHAISPSSAICERAFSISGILINQKASKIHPERVKKYLFVHANYELLRED